MSQSTDLPDNTIVFGKKLLLSPHIQYLKLTQLGSSWMRQYYMEFNLTSQNLAIYEPNQTFCGSMLFPFTISELRILFYFNLFSSFFIPHFLEWEIGLPGGGSMFLNFVVIGSIFGFMILSMGSYIFYTACIEKQPEYIHIQ